MNSDRPTEGVNPTDPKQPELNPDHEELKRQIFAGIKLMLDPIKEDIKQIKLDQRDLKSDTDSCTGKQLKRQIIKNEEKQKKLETQISALEDQLLQKNVIFQGLKEDKYEDIQDTKTKVISAIANVSTGNTPEERNDTAKKVPIDSVEWLGKYISTRNRPVKVKFTNKTDIDNLFKNQKKLPDGVFIDKEYSRATEKEWRLLWPVLKAARKIEEFKGHCQLEGPYFKIDGKKYHRYNIHTLPTQLGPTEVTSVSDEDRIGFSGELNPFSNFHSSAFVVEGLEYHSSEQFRQATKAEYFGDNIAKERILRCEDTMDNKEISMDITNFNKWEWSRVAEELCYPGIMEKFFQNPGLMAALLNTGTKKLVESSYNDLWGTGIPMSNPNALDETKWKSPGLFREDINVC